MPTIFIPFVAKEYKGSALFIPEREMLAKAILSADWQQRKGGYVDPLLMEAAQYKADDMHDNNYFAHTSPSGETPNEYVRNTGYRLPSWYPQEGNNVESLGIGHPTYQRVIDGWLNSPKHRAHVAAENDFYRSHKAVGVGLSNHPDGRRVWVFVSAPPTE